MVEIHSVVELLLLWQVDKLMLSFSEKKDQQRTERDVALKVCVKCHMKRNYGSENAVVRV